MPAFTRACYRRLGLPLSFPYWKGKPAVTVRYGKPIDASGADLIKLGAKFWAEFDALARRAQ